MPRRSRCCLGARSQGSLLLGRHVYGSALPGLSSHTACDACQFDPSYMAELNHDQVPREQTWGDAIWMFSTGARVATCSLACAALPLLVSLLVSSSKVNPGCMAACRAEMSHNISQKVMCMAGEGKNLHAESMLIYDNWHNFIPKAVALIFSR